VLSQSTEKPSHTVAEKPAPLPVKTFEACEKNWTQVVEIQIGLHTNKIHNEEKYDTDKDKAIRATITEELKEELHGQVCVAEGRSIPIKFHEQKLMKIPLHVYGNNTEDGRLISHALKEHAKTKGNENGVEILLNGKHWPPGAFLLEVEGMNIEELKCELGVCAEKRRSKNATIFVIVTLVILGFLGVFVYRRRHRYFRYNGDSIRGQLIV